MAQSRDQPSLGELFSDLSRQTSTLVRQEVTLAKTEMSEKATAVVKDIGMIVAGGAVAYAGLLALIAALVILLAEVVPWWLSALIVGAVVAGLGYLLIQRGREALKHQNLAPQQTIESLKEDAQWAREQTR